MSVIDDAIKELQNHAVELASVNVKAAPDYPPEGAHILPLAVTYISTGTGQADNATTARLLLTVNVDIHFDRVNLAMAYRQINNVIPEYLKKLAGDPTLRGAVDTIVFPVSFMVQPAEWDAVVTQMVSFSVPLKFMETPST